VLVAFGGAGPVHAAALAAELHMAGVIVPAHPGVFSALGLLMADVQHDHVRSRLDGLAGVAPADVLATFAELAESATAELLAEGFEPDTIELDYALDIRYQGQGYEVTVPVTLDSFVAGDIGIVRKAFDEEHLERFGHAALGEAAEIVSYRLTGRGLVSEVRLPEHIPAGRTLADAEVARRPVRFGPYLLDCPIYARELLDVGMTFTGPAVIDQQDTTVVVLPGRQVRVDAWLNLFLSGAEQTSTQGVHR
jgi:N-methylhydantoinase A